MAMAMAVRRLRSSPALCRTMLSSRSFSASSAARHENIEETYKWRKITAAGYIACLALGVYTFATEEHHEQHEKPEYSYLHVRNKEFPWGPDGLFEVKHDH